MTGYAYDSSLIDHMLKLVVITLLGIVGSHPASIEALSMECAVYVVITIKPTFSSISISLDYLPLLINYSGLN
jgi:hypothetical protein